MRSYYSRAHNAWLLIIHINKHNKNTHAHAGARARAHTHHSSRPLHELRHLPLQDCCMARAREEPLLVPAVPLEQHSKQDLLYL